jgi:hypothetical protein
MLFFLNTRHLLLTSSLLVNISEFAKTIIFPFAEIKFKALLRSVYLISKSCSIKKSTELLCFS